MRKNVANKRLNLSKETLVILQEFVVGGRTDWCANSAQCTNGSCACVTSNLSDCTQSQ